MQGSGAKMDFHTGLVCAAVVIVSAVVVFVISMVGIKEKTYEEAIAEQRKMPEQNLLLGRVNKDKGKDKKQKKLGKKTKEKPTDHEKSNKVLTGPTETTVPVQDKTRINFEEPSTKVISEHPPVEEKKKKKKEKVKPILINKEEKSPVTETTPPPVNHFEEIQPKDDLLIKRKESKDDINIKGISEPAVTESIAEHERAPQKIPLKHIPIKNDRKLEKLTVAAVQQEQTSVPVIKERTKKKKSELATLQQMSGDREGVNINLLLPLVRKSELSRSEIQMLIDLLLNKQQNSTGGHSEWIEGRQDVVVKLKKQLAEKEKALLEEQEVTQSFQNKLKELRGEFNLERSRLGQSNRQLEENLATKQNEIKALTARIQHAHETHVTEKQALSQQSQQTEVTFKAQIGQLHAQLQEQENINEALSTDVQKLRENQVTKDGENNILREQISHLENQIRHLESQNAHLKENSDHAQELARQVEELHRIKTELELHIATSRQQEASLQYESGKLHEELELLKEKCACYNELLNENTHLRSENEKMLIQTTNFSELQVELQHFQEENERLLSQMSMYSHLEIEAQQLREENESLAAQLTAMTERPAAEGRENEDQHYTEEKQEDVSQQESMIKENELLFEKLSEQLKEKDYLLEKLSSEIHTYKTEISELNEELESQRRKNNELRTKNWKVMEALSATEKSLGLKVKEFEKVVSDVRLDARSEHQKATKNLLRRIFPAIQIEENKNFDAWIEVFENAVKNYFSQQKAQAPLSSMPEDHSAVLIEVEKQNAQLQAMVTHYKTIIEETEGMLNKLQNHVEQEEARWRQQLQMKESELESIKEERDMLEQSLEHRKATEESFSTPPEPLSEPSVSEKRSKVKKKKGGSGKRNSREES